MYTKALPLTNANIFQRYAGLVFWVAIGAIYLSMMAQWISLDMGNQELVEYTKHVIRLGATQDRSVKEIRQLMLNRAEMLSLPLDETGIRITGSGDKIRASLNYEADVIFPILHRPVYRVKFSRDIAYTPPR